MVQPSGVNALIAIVAAPPASTTSANAAVDDGDLGQQFSQLLSDSGKEYDEQAAGQPFFKGKLLQTAALGALSAQEIPLHGTAHENRHLEARTQLITPADASVLAARIDKILAQDRAPASVAAFTQIKDQLLRISRSGEPKTIAEVLQAAPAVKESKLSLLGLTALLSPRKTEAKTARDEEEEVSTASAVLQPVPTAIFRPDPSDDVAAKGAPGEQKTQARDEVIEAADTITVITPLSAIGLTAALPAQAASPAVGGAQPGIRFEPLPPVQDIDVRIPPLGIRQTEDDGLPEVNLPTLRSEVSVEATGRAGTFEKLAAAQGILTERLKLSDVAAEAGDKRSEALTALNNPSHTQGFSPTQTVNAAQPAHVVPTHGYINHAPVTEQVHVAVRQAAKDGIEQITVQLDPVELGRVEVNIRTDREGQTQISFLVDKPDTFDNLSRDARTLERSLQEAGIKADTGSMQFNLRQQAQPQLHSDLNGQGQHNQPQAQAKEDANGVRSAVAAAETATRNYIFNVREGVDISA